MSLKKVSHAWGTFWERTSKTIISSPLPQSPIDLGQTQFILLKPQITKELSPGFLLWPILTNLLGVGGRQWKGMRCESLMLLSAGDVKSNLQKTHTKRFLSCSIKKQTKTKTRRVNPLPTVTTINLKWICLPLMQVFPGYLMLPRNCPCSFCPVQTPLWPPGLVPAQKTQLEGGGLLESPRSTPTCNLYTPRKLQIQPFCERRLSKLSPMGSPRTTHLGKWL